VVLFILAACVPPQEVDQAATATQELVEGSSSRLALPASVLLEDGQEVDISLSNYPTNSDNFIIDTRTNEEKMALIRSWAPDDVKKEIELYNAEFKRTGIDTNDIEYQTSIVDGKSWTLYPKNIKNGRVYIVSLNGIIRPSIDLFGYLDRDTNDDFFDLKLVNIPGGEVVGDKSGWHVFARVENEQVTQWYNATNDQIEKVEIPIPEPSPTPENQLRVVGIEEAKEMFDRMDFSTEFPRITLEDITSGRLLDMERKWIDEHPFSSEVVPVDFVKNTNKTTTLAYPEGVSKKVTMYEINFKTNPNLDYQKNPNLRPFKVIGFYNFWDEKIYNDSGYFKDYIHQSGSKGGGRQLSQIIEKKGTLFSVISFAIQNSDGEVIIGHFLSPTDDMNGYFNLIFNKTTRINGETVTWDYDTKINLIYDLEYIEDYENMLTCNAFINYIWKNYPETSPKPFIDQIVKTDSFPKEIEKTLFTFYPLINDPW
jgi:hypothetical protein